MLGIWLGVALVNISGYQPIAEQTWVQLNPEYYPVHRAVPSIFVAWRGNQFPPLEQKKKNGHWLVLFPARLVPPFDLFEGEAELSKAYLARLKRIDEMAYGMAPHQAVNPAVGMSAPMPSQEGLNQPFIAEFSLPGIGGESHRLAPPEPLLASLVRHGALNTPPSEPAQVQLAATTRLEETTLTLSAPAAGSRVCHQVAAGETLWRIASQLVSQGGTGGADTYSYLLALVEDNRTSMGKGIRVQTGQSLYCPRAETLAQFDAMSPVQRQQQFARLEQGR
ncbi:MULTISPECIES: hypothetical protein [Aeromonas]|uniref:hypothetical protein n=1 Tax=Aeromonas TaxID=642 RepID=UPI00051C33D4|nr:MULTISPECIES: hypothetical protein [Aeromonas]MCH7373492.1 hypothetical protein [Aeromonas sp. MR16]